MRRKESSRSRRDCQTKLRIQSHHRLKSNRVWAKVIQLMDQLLNGIAGILVICLWTIVWCTCSHIILYPSCASQIPINDNLVKKDINCSKECEKDIKQDSKYLQSRWCPSGLSHIQKRRLQWMRKKESMEQQAKVLPARSATMKQVWRPKRVVSSPAWRRTKIWPINCYCP